MKKLKVGDIILFKNNIITVRKKIKARIVELPEPNFHDDSYLVELLGEFRGKGHNGNGFSKYRYAGNNYFYVFCDDMTIKVLPPDGISITVHGRRVVAEMRKDGEVIERAEAKCHLDDKFDERIGFKLAFDRLLGINAEPAAKRGYFMCGDTFYGVIGDKSPMRDILGNELYVGDEVMCFKKSAPEEWFKAPIVYNHRSKLYFIRGICSCCNRDGRISDFVVIKTKSYDTLMSREKIGALEVVIK